MTTIRQERVSELLFQELSVLIGAELKDPRLSLITVTAVDVSRDLRSARVFVSAGDAEIPQRTTLAGLRAAAPFLRRELAQRCNLRVVPELNFVYDDTPARAARINELLQQIAAERPQGQIDGDPALAEPPAGQGDAGPTGP